MHTILLIDDDNRLASLLEAYFARYDLKLLSEVDPLDGLKKLQENSAIELVVLDIMLPGMDGFEVCRQARAGYAGPILMMTAKDEDIDQVVGLEIGADDYVVKPFSVPELMARVRAMLRRAKPEIVTKTLFAGDIELDRETHRVRRATREIHLGPTEFKLLEFLMQHPGRVYSREQLLDGVWGHDVYVDERTVDVHIGRLRKAINKGRAKDPIRTVRGSGYSLNDQFQD